MRLPGQEGQSKRRKRARVDRCRKEGDGIMPPRASGLGLIEQENDPEEIIGLCVHFVNIFAEDLEELNMQDMSQPIPSHEKLESEGTEQEKILEPIDRQQILALISEALRTKEAVEADVPRVAALTAG